MTTTTLVLSFLDEEGNVANISIKNPKENLKKAAVETVMNTIITNGALQSNQEEALVSINDHYYKEVTTTALATA